jgi:hypothetical protein
VFVPAKGDAFFTLLLNKAADPDLAIIGPLSFSKGGIAKLYRLHASRYSLVLRELSRPEETQQAPAAPLKPATEKENAMFDQLVMAMTEDFDPAAYSNDRINAVRKALVEAAGGDAEVIDLPVPKPAGESMEDLLAAAIAAAAAKKAS